LVGLEQHLANLQRQIEEFGPAAVVLDPISNLAGAGTVTAAGAMLVRLFDFLKATGITAVVTPLTGGAVSIEATDVGVSSLVDTWLLLRNVEADGERNRVLHVLKSRGTGHSNQLREFRLTDRGIELADVYVGPEGVLTGSARVEQEARETAAALRRGQEQQRRRRELDRKQRALEARIESLRIEYEAESEELQRLIEESEGAEGRLQGDRVAMAARRHADLDDAGNGDRQKGRRP
jgi:circadian clock protein KaiC